MTMIVTPARPSRGVRIAARTIYLIYFLIAGAWFTLEMIGDRRFDSAPLAWSLALTILFATTLFLLRKKSSRGQRLSAGWIGLATSVPVLAAGGFSVYHDATNTYTSWDGLGLALGLAGVILAVPCFVAALMAFRAGFKTPRRVPTTENAGLANDPFKG